jgi:hypothetical protein
MKDKPHNVVCNLDISRDGYTRGSAPQHFVSEQFAQSFNK